MLFLDMISPLLLAWDGGSFEAGSQLVSILPNPGRVVSNLLRRDSCMALAVAKERDRGKRRQLEGGNRFRDKKGPARAGLFSTLDLTRREPSDVGRARCKGREGWLTKSLSLCGLPKSSEG